MSKSDRPVVVMVGPSESLNGATLTGVQGVLRTDVVNSEFLDPKSTDAQKQKLAEYLTGCLQVDFGDPQEIFLEVTSREADQIGAVCVDISLQLGESFRNGNYTEIEKVFPNCKWLFLCCKHNGALEVRLLREQEGLSITAI